MSNKDDKLSVFISLILRHKPETVKITIDNQGYTDVDTLIKGVNDSGRFLDLERLKTIVNTDKKQRYSFNDNFTKIRANQGHSLDYVKIEMETPIPPLQLYHGTNEDNLDKIFELGLLKGNRNDVHLSKDIETAIQVGSRRQGETVLLIVKARDMYEDGYILRLSENKVWLTDCVPPKYVEVYKEN